MKKFFSLFAAVLFAGAMMAETVTLKYTGSTTQNMQGNAKNNASLVNLDANLWVVTSLKNSASAEVGLNKDGSMRLYADKTNGNGTIMTVFYDFGIINSITVDVKQATEMEVTSDGDPVTGSENVYTINSQAFTIQNVHTGDKADQLWLNSVTITYTPNPDKKVATPIIAPALEEFVNSIEISITCATENAKIYYTLDGTYPEESATNLYSAPFTVDKSVQVHAIAILGEDKSSSALKNYTKVDPWTVEEAIGALTGASPISNKFVKGVICKIDEFSTNYSTITYWISDDGATGDNDKMLEVYSGLGLNGEKFSSINDLKVGDGVIVFGNLKVYKSDGKPDIYEFDKNNYLVEHLAGPQGINNNTAVEATAVKKIVNGQLIIEKNGVRHNAAGQIVK